MSTNEQQAATLFPVDNSFHQPNSKIHPLHHASLPFLSLPLIVRPDLNKSFAAAGVTYLLRND